MKILKMKTIVYFAVVLLFLSVILAKKTKKCKGLDGKKYKVGKGYETECEKFTCTKSKGRKRPKMMETRTCCEDKSNVHKHGDDISWEDHILHCCKGSWVLANFTGFDPAHCEDAGIIPFNLTDLKQTKVAYDAHNWMSKVSGSRHLNELSIPGTHDTMAYKGAGATIWHLCQSKNLWNQFKAGVRFIDIRLNLKGNGLGCYHGNAYLETRFIDVMSTIYSYLYHYSTETILMRVSNENGDDNTYNFCNTFNRVLRTYPVKIWNDGDNKMQQGFAYNSAWGGYYPKLQDARGKLVVLNWDGKSGCFGFQFDMKDLDNYDGKQRHPLTGRECADVVEWEWGRRKRRSLEENLNTNKTVEDVQSYRINQTDQNENKTVEDVQNYRIDQTDQNENKNSFRLRNNVETKIADQVQIKETSNNTKETNLAQKPGEKQTRFGYEASDDYKRELETYLGNVRGGYKDFMMWTWASAFDWKVHNERLASHVNPSLRNYLNGNPHGRVGIVAFDYIDNWNSDLPRLIYERNFESGYACQLYEHCNKGGRWLKIWAGAREWTLNPWSFNDRASSFSIRPGCYLRVWEHANYQGRVGRIYGDMNCIEWSWNDVISSVQCVC